MMTKVHYSGLEDKFWIRDGADGVLWFETEREAIEGAHQLQLDTAAQAERDRIAAWLRRIGKPQMADAVEAGEFGE